MVNQESNVDIITNVTRNDVILGRGAGPNEHAGNIAFRGVIDEFKPAYMATINRKIKCQIARKVVTAIKARRGRFLKRAHGRDDGDEIYVLAEEEVVMEKAKQALRHGAHRISRCAGSSRRNLSSSSGEGTSHRHVDLSNQGDSSCSAKLSSMPSFSDQFCSTPPTAIYVPATMMSMNSTRPETSVTTNSLDTLDSSTIQTALQSLIAEAEQRRLESSLPSVETLDLVHSLLASNNTKELFSAPSPHPKFTNINASWQPQQGLHQPSATTTPTALAEVANLVANYSLLSKFLAPATSTNRAPFVTTEPQPQSPSLGSTQVPSSWQLLAQNLALASTLQFSQSTSSAPSLFAPNTSLASILGTLLTQQGLSN